MQELEPGSTFGRYEIEGVLGRGGMAVVYRATERHLQRPVALKLITPRADYDAASRARFQREALAAASLEHPHVVPIYAAGIVGDTPYLAMRFVDGIDLDRLVELEGRLEPARAVRLIGQVASALDAAHRCGLVHRDIKPANILIDHGSNGEIAYLTDFGVAQQTSDGAERLTSSGQWMGTPAYAAPEQLRGEQLDGRTDVYALACVLFKPLTGRAPYQRETPSALMWAHIEDPPPLVRELANEVPAALEPVVQSGMAKLPADRPASAGALAIAARAALVGEVSAERRQSAGELAGAASATLTRRQPASVHNLPIPPTSLVGRRREVAAVSELLQREDVRLVTLTGPGGSGKTRLGLAVAAEVIEAFADGVFLVDLAPVADPLLVAAWTAQALKVREQSGEALDDTLAAELSDKQLLLVLDNFEQVVDAAAFVARLLESAPRLKILVTSRTPLHLRAEHEFATPPLPLPDLARPAAAEVLAENDSVALFVERARAASHDFQLSDDAARAVAELCVRLDGLPLAIELAAARSKLLAPEAILERLGDRLKLLTGGPRDVPSRQRTLRGAIDWSYSLLDQPERRLFERLAVFVGGRTVEAAEAVCDPHGELGGDVLDGLGSLLDHNLIVARVSTSGRTRFAMLETIHEYASERLAASSEHAELRQRHASFFLELATRAEPRLRARDQTAWLDRLEEDHDNLRAALHWLARTGDSESELRLAAALSRFWIVRGHISEGLRFVERALTNSPPGATPQRLHTLWRACMLALRRGDNAASIRYAVESLSVAEALGDRVEQAWTLIMLGIQAQWAGTADDSHAWFARSIELSREIGADEPLSAALSNYADNRLIAADYAGAEAFQREALAITESIGAPDAIVQDLATLAHALLGQDRVPEAAELGVRCFRLSYDNVLPEGTAMSLDLLAAVAAAQDAPRRAAVLLGAADAARETLGMLREPADREIIERLHQLLEVRLSSQERALAAREGSAMPLAAIRRHVLVGDDPD